MDVFTSSLRQFKGSMSFFFICKLKADFASQFVLQWICARIHSCSNLSYSQFIENDSIGSNLSFSINWESDRLEKEWIRAQIHYNTNFGAKSRYWIYIWTKYKVCSLRRTRRTSFGANYFQNQGIHSILRIHKSDPTETRKSRNWRSFGARMRSELDFITSVCCGGKCDLKG